MVFKYRMNYNEFMSKLILALTLILSLGFTTTSVADGQLSEHLHDIDYSGLSDASVCSWFQVVPVPEDFINEAKKRGLTCGGVKYSSNNEVIKPSNKQESNKSSKIPKNAHKSSAYPLGWSCDVGYTQLYVSGSTGGMCSKVKIPKNAYASTSASNGWKCNTGFISRANKCWKKNLKIPNNAYASAMTNEGWKCFSPYKKVGSRCVKPIFVPSNASENASGTGWACNKGYYIRFNRCTSLPSNSYASGASFACNDGYSKVGILCRLKMPSNSYASGSGWKCNPGFEKNGNSCIEIPSNSYASGSGWKCNSGYERKENSCIEIPDDTIYRAGSGTGFATTYDGHILTNHHVIDGCTQVTVHNKGKSYITTVITQDPKNDLAILISDYKPSKIYTLSTEVYLSDDIYAAGFPFGKRISSSITVNRGIISALMGPGDDISKFQIDADINSGNSGGPIVDKQGNAIGIAVSKLNREKALEELGSVPEGFNFAVNSMMAIGLFRSQGIDLPVQNNSELSVKDRNDLFNQGTFYLACGMTTAQYEKMAKTDKVMFTREVFFSDFQGN